MIAARELEIFRIQHCLQSGLYIRFIQMQEIAEAEGFLAVFVTVCIGDAASGGAECRTGFRQTILLQPVLYLMPRHRDGCA